MKRRLAILLALVLLASPVVPAQTNGSAESTTTANAEDWQDLKNLKPGKKIMVEFKPNVSAPVEGKFISAIGSRLTLTSDGRSRSFEQRDIQSVYRLKGRWSRATKRRIGMAIGAVLGLVIDNAFINPIDRPVTATDDGTPSVGGLVVGGLAGAGIGHLLGSNRKGKLLYEAK